jgi:hypothetical protein
MNKILFASLLLIPILCHGMWADVSLKELAKETDYAVIASLSDVKKWTKNGIDFGKGTLTISDFLSPRRPNVNRITLIWSNPSGLICPRVEHEDSHGQQYIWLLQRTKDGSVTADYPGRTVDLKEKKKVISLMRKYQTEQGAAANP